MHQTKKGNEWHFGMKVHIGVDADTGLVHSVSTTAANAHDITEAHPGRLHHGRAGSGRVSCSQYARQRVGQDHAPEPGLST